MALLLIQDKNAEDEPDMFEGKLSQRVEDWH
jgi:hypothetical protein